MAFITGLLPKVRGQRGWILGKCQVLLRNPPCQELHKSCFPVTVQQEDLGWVGAFDPLYVQGLHARPEQSWK